MSVLNTSVEAIPGNIAQTETLLHAALANARNVQVFDIGAESTVHQYSKGRSCTWSNGNVGLSQCLHQSIGGLIDLPIARPIKPVDANLRIPRSGNDRIRTCVAHHRRAQNIARIRQPDWRQATVLRLRRRSAATAGPLPAFSIAGGHTWLIRAIFAR